MAHNFLFSFISEKLEAASRALINENKLKAGTCVNVVMDFGSANNASVASPKNSFSFIRIQLDYSNKEVNTYCERFEPRSHFKSRRSLIVRVNVVLNRTVVVDSD